MAEAQRNPVVNHIRHLIGSASTSGMTDGQLLERFLSDHDESAIEGLIRRYGPLVFGACRRVLHNTHAAEDVFQATFLVLVRKAPVLERDRPLGNWLYTVAYRLALRARANEARRRYCEAESAHSRQAVQSHAKSTDDLVVALEEELQRLPEKHRAPLVLCYLEGRTNEQAADVLGCPRGSMSARLNQARERLRECLARRGHVAPSTGIVALLTTAAADAAVPLPLLADTVCAALWFTGEGAPSGGLVSIQAVALAQSAFRTMFVHKLKIVAAALLAAIMLGTGATLLLKAATQTEPAAQSSNEVGRIANPSDTSPEKLPTGAIARMGSTRLRHGDAIYFAAYTPEGQALVTAGKDKTVRLWNLASGREIRRFDWGNVTQIGTPESAAQELHERWEQQFWDNTARSGQAALSPDGKIVAASLGGVVCLWETACGKKQGTLQTGQSYLLQLSFSADSKSLLTLGPGQATAIWDVATGKCIQRREGKPTSKVAIELPDFVERLATVSSGWRYLAYQRADKASTTAQINIIDLATSKELPAIQSTPLATALTFSPDEKTLVWFSLRDGIVISDVATGRELRRLGGVAVNVTLDIALSADGKSLAVSRADHSIDLWDLPSGKQIGRVGQATDVDQVKCVADILGALVRPALAFSPDGRRFISSLGGAAIRQFRADTGEEIPGPAGGQRAVISALSLSADGKSLCTYGPGEPLRLWDWASGKEIGQRRLPGNSTRAVFATDGRFAFAADGKATLCSQDGKKLCTFPTAGPRLIALALSPDGSVPATRDGSPREVHLWDTATGEKRRTLGRSSNGPRISRGVVAEASGVVSAELVFSPDGRLLAGLGPQWQLWLWDVATGALLWEVLPQAGKAIERFAFSPNGFCLATVNGNQTVTLYEVATGATRCHLGEANAKSRKLDLTGLSDFSYLGWRQSPTTCVAFSPDGRHLAVTRDTPVIHLRDVIAGREVGQLKGHSGGVVSLLFTPDGQHLISGSTDTTALTWDLTRLTRQSVATTADAPLQLISAAPETLATLWTELSSNDAMRAFNAIRKLSTCPEQAVTLLKERVHAATPAEPQRMAQLLADLKSERFKIRRQAESELIGLGEVARPDLLKALADNPSQDLRKRLEQLVDRLSGRLPSAVVVRDFAAVELLEVIGSPDARRHLESLALGLPGARLTQEVKVALKRLSKRVVMR